jgi:hypothetical protein
LRTLDVEFGYEPLTIVVESLKSFLRRIYSPFLVRYFDNYCNLNIAVDMKLGLVRKHSSSLKSFSGTIDTESK